jgi:hypothetical protein
MKISKEESKYESRKKRDTLYTEFKIIVVFEKYSENKLAHSGKIGIRRTLKSKLIKKEKS